MSFVDEVRIHVRAGNGGNGCTSFHRAKYRARGAADGGDGGNGGSVVLLADEREASLMDFRHAREWSAANGERGGKDNRHGADGADLVIPVPVGTMVYYEPTDELLGDLVQDKQRLVVARGGEGGVGNSAFKSGSNRGSSRTIPGSSGEQAELRMEMCLPADVGLLGLPNAGKSSLLQTISEARPRVGDYPFTTQQPQPGVVRVEDAAGFELERFVMADMPGLIKGASSGAGLGTKFLRHLRRTRLLLHVIDASADSEEVLAGTRELRSELAEASPSATDRPMWLVLNKSDRATPEHLRELQEALAGSADGQPIYIISALTGEGCQTLCTAIAEFLVGNMSGQNKRQKAVGI